ncbi:hypothetical protein SARC_06744 [Sphaeroforma arctica JP610]|uniref:CST complex subunit Stn1 N-terminal domain-containing protein n=1 Tax=Sphaeroforma arctica JP610 TaxID=667725 RepID=A0A0L0FY61_9EUKA|nr:hypothetical protein SARC_06744 [Sphaeroforma arctica JP610]KNC80903.1 hypothetical protein SARC_06744 [Sphaeroforma arctica JP610]|eukprot:XP_014154805.1 hypothetical protein SARC_06744 [Sphaeroforma arctica JP610]
MSMQTIKSAEILQISEIRQLADNVDGYSVRTIGKVIAVNLIGDWVTIAHNGWELRIDTSLLEPLAYRENSLYQFIGELQVLKLKNTVPNEARDDGSIALKARIGRCVDGMDLGLYMEALMQRRKYLQADHELMPE